MSAFAVVLSADGAPSTDGTLDRMMTALRRHGPHASAFVREGGVAMLHALHATHDGATLGPHRSAAGVLLAGDIRIDGQRELRRALGAHGMHVAANAGDDALVLAAWETWGEAAPEHLLGDYAFVLWDPRTRRLFAARDALGLRPLYYAQIGTTTICSSLLDVVRAHPSVSARLYDPAILSFLATGSKVDTSRTTFADIARVPAGHCGAWTPERPALTLRRYWTFPDPAPLRARDGEIIEGYRAALGDAVRDRLRTPSVVIPLSGGLDSTSITASARRASPGVAVTSFTVGDLTSAVDDEARLAQLVAQRLGTTHVIHEFPFGRIGLDDDPTLRTPEPVADLTHSRTMRILHAMSAHSLVHLRGEDGDRLLKPVTLRVEARRFGGARTAWRALHFAATHGRLPYTGFGVRDRLRGTPTRTPVTSSLLRADAIARFGMPSEPAPPLTARPMMSDGLLSPVWQEMVENEMPGVVGIPLDSRWPLLDVRLLTFVLSIPTIPWCQQKEIVRRAFASELPPEIIRRPKTMAWLTAYGIHDQWRAQQRQHPVTLSDRVAEWVDIDRAREVLRRGESHDVEEAWTVLALDFWLQALDRRGA